MSIDKRNHTGGKSKSKTSANFNRAEMEAVQGQNMFLLNFRLTSDSLVFINGSPVGKNEYLGQDTNTILFKQPLNQFDKVIIIS